MGDDDRHPVMLGRVLSSATPTVPERVTSPPADAPGQVAGTRSQSGDTAEPAFALGVPPAHAAAPAPNAPMQPSWSRILATTIKLWVLRRMRPPGSGRERGSGPEDRSWFRRRLGHLGRVAARRWHPAVLVLALAVIAAVALGLTELSRTAPQAGRMPSAGNSAAGSAGRAGTPGTSSLASAGAKQAAAWIVSQVSGAAIIACDPAMCAVLQAQGVNAGRLMPMRPGSDNPLGSSVVVTSSPASSQLAGEYAPAVIASFGSGGTRVDVRATEPGGAAAYESRAAGRSRRPRERGRSAAPKLAYPVHQAGCRAAAGG